MAISIKNAAIKNAAYGPKAVTVNNGLVLWLDAGNLNSYSDSAGATWTDLSGNGNNGTLVGGPTYTSANGGSITFNGIGQRATFPYGPTLGITSFTSTWTVDVWFKVNTFDLPFKSTEDTDSPTEDTDSPIENRSGDGVGVVDTHPSDRGASVIGYEKDGLNRIFYTGRADSTTTFVTIFGPSVELFTYYNVTLVRNGTTNTQLYINAGISSTYVGNVALTTIPGLAPNSVIAAYDDNNYDSSPISVSNIKIYDRALTSAEIAQNFFATRSRFSI